MKNYLNLLQNQLIVNDNYLFEKGNENITEMKKKKIMKLIVIK